MKNLLTAAAIMFAAAVAYADPVFVVDSNGDGVEQVTLQGSNSRDPDGALIDYEWSVNGATIAAGFGPTVLDLVHTYTLGWSTVTLAVRDDVFVSSAAAINVVVLPQGSSPPSDDLDPSYLAGRKWSRVVGLDFAFSDIYEDYAGITFNPLTQTYFMTENQEDVIIEINLSGVLLRTINVHELRASGEIEADIEGITWMQDQTFALVSEGGEEMVIAQIGPGTTALNRSGVTIYDLFGDPKGVAYKASEDAIYWVSQGAPMRVVKAKINQGTGQLDVIFNRDVSGLPASDLADAAFFPSISPNLFLISQSTTTFPNVVLEVDVEGPTPVLFSAFALAPWPIPKPGALTMNHLGQIIIVGKHQAGVPEDDFNVFIPVEDVPPAIPALPSGSPTVSINWIHPGSTVQQAEFFLNITETGSGEIFIYDQLGRQVHEFRTEQLPPGEYRAPWDLRNSAGTHIASGVYYVLIKTPGSTRKEKLVYVR